MKNVILFPVIETCEKCGSKYLKTNNVLGLLVTERICPKCRGKRTVDKGKRILDIITER